MAITDGRKNNGAKKGENRGQGRKPKSEEIKLAEKIKHLEPAAIEALEKGVKKGDFKFIQLFFHYYAGKPREMKAPEGEETQKVIIVGYDNQ